MSFSLGNDELDNDLDEHLLLGTALSSGGKEKKSKADSNEIWNSTHIRLVRDLEKKGTYTRYGVRHLKLWTDLIVSGKCKGFGDEPAWEEFISEIGVPPKSRTVEQKKNEQEMKDNTSQLLQTIILQNQTKKETFQNALLAMMNTSVTLLQVRYIVITI